MEKGFKNIALFFAVTAAIVLIGFFPTYLSHFPYFEGFVALLVLGIPNLLLMYVPHTAWWQSFAEGIVKAMN